jgi:ABC-2 type transport system ATP-binding protein
MDVQRESMAIRQIIGYVPQQRSIDSSLTGWENVWLFARLFDVPARERKERIAASLDTVGLIDAAHRLARTYSGGMVRRLELAQALINRPRLLIMDEPTIGLDPVARSDVWERVEALRGLLIGTPTNLALDFGVLIVALIAGITAAAALLGRLARG